MWGALSLETQDDEDRRAGKPLRREISWGAVVSGAALAFTLYKAANTVYSNVDHRIDSISLVVHSNDEFKRRQIDELGRVVARIERIETTISGCRENIVALQSRTISRNEAATRDDCQELKARIHALEQRKP